jgi:hypothetical protein
MFGWFAPPIAAVTLLHLSEFTTDWFVTSDGPLTKNETVPTWLITLVPKLVAKPPPTLYWTNSVEFGTNAEPSEKLFK